MVVFYEFNVSTLLGIRQRTSVDSWVIKTSYPRLVVMILVVTSWSLPERITTRLMNELLPSNVPVDAYRNVSKQRVKRTDLLTHSMRWIVAVCGS
jgi:hypothetical protein